ncbi:MAG: glucose-1-phosphate thymidylyltransferase RfbA [Kofleriaceae bacterium]
MGTKGILLAGGSGSRLFPLTAVMSKQLLPIYDKPMVHYPLSTLMLGGVREVLLISTPAALPMFEQLLKDGRQWGIEITYAAQPRPEGIAQAFTIGADFIGDDRVALVLGDNLFFGPEFGLGLAERFDANVGATIFAYWVRDPERYGVVEIDANDRVVDIVEKPAKPRSNYVVPGLYIYDNDVVNIAHRLRPSPRGELEITDVNTAYLRAGRLRVHRLSRGNAWLDTGTFDALLEAAQFVQVVERRQGLKVSCVEEVAFRRGWIDAAQIEHLATGYGASDYARYLRSLIEGP